MAYVPQSDVLIPSLTVQECLRYSALLRLPPDTSPLTLQVGGAGHWPCFLAFCAILWALLLVTRPMPHTPAPNRWHFPPAPPSLQVAIERVLDELGLRHVADAPVGGSGGIRGVSGGERRR